VRGRSDAERLKWEKIKSDPTLVARQVSAAHAKRRGQKDSLAVRVKRAKAISGTYAIMGRAEVVILDAIRERCPDLVFQLAVGPYNVDGAFCGDRIAVEVQLGNINKPNSSIAGHRIKDILDAGWRVLLIVCNNATRDGYSVGAITEQVVAFRELCRRNPSTLGQYGMIGRHGQPLPGFRDDLAQLPRVLGF
jgi:very-short-patch-repair endonuclease